MLTSCISQSQKHYRRFYRLVVFAVILMMAVLTGSLMLGDSVRGTLVQRVSERLGKTETIITSGTGFMSENLIHHPVQNHAQGYLLMDGFLSVGEKLLPVYVWGTDADSLSPGEALINEPLRSKLSSANSQSSTLILHLPSHNLVPSGSLFVTKSYATQMRVNVTGVKSVEEGGNLLLKNEQTLPLNVFVNRRYLAENVELEGKINLVLSNDFVSEDQLATHWTPEMSGIHLTDSALTCDGVFIPQDIVDRFSTVGEHTTLYFSYFVNELSSIHSPLSVLHYSFVTAVNEWQGEPLDGKDIILSDYAAKRMNVHEGDSVRMEYFITKHLKNLDTQAQTLRVKRIVPLSSFRHDSLLMADFSGLTHVEKCTDWDSDLPIDMSLIQKEDEDYWYAYRQTPKAIVSYEAVSADWSSAFGSATAMRFTSRPDISLSPSDANVQLNHPRAQGLKAATGGVDFASLFLSLGFFIILAAVLLMKNPLLEMFTQREDEIQLYRQLGFSDKKIGLTLFREAFGVILFASPFGVIAGLLYSSLTLWLLGNVWSGATHTEGFALHIKFLTLFAGWVIGLLICAFVLWRVLRSQLRRSKPSSASFFRPLSSSLLPLTPYFLLLLTIGLIAINFIWLHSIVLFVICGLLWVLTWGLFLRLSVFRSALPFVPSKNSQSSTFSRSNLTWQSIRSSFRQHHLAYWTLSLGVFMVFAVGLNRPDFSQSDQVTLGYQFYVDSRVPIQYDLNNPAVRRKLSLQYLPDSTEFLGFLRHTQDEASCLNLNQVSTPTVLAPLSVLPMEGQKAEHLEDMESSLPWGKLESGVYIDQEALMWGLKKSVGDTLFYQNDRGESVPVVIAGTYPTGIFHGNAIMSPEEFRRLWPKEVGVEVLLMRSSHPDEAAELLSTAMSEYGLNIQTMKERMDMFFEVTETYLIIFLTLGGLGLLLGIFSLMIIVRKNLTAQATTIRQYCAMGFSEELIKKLLLRENLIVPFYAVAVGATGSVISISANIAGAGMGTFLLAAMCLVAICLLLYYGIKFMINQSLTLNPYLFQ